MSGPRTSRSGLRPWHELVEHYTPDGSLGRLLLAAAAGSVGGTALFLALAVVVETAPFWPVTALVASAVGLAGVGLALVVLWPVYLSLIGNVESASAYSGESATRSASAPDPDATTAFDTTADFVVPGDSDDFDAADSTADSDDAVATLKRRYAAGEITEEEFERRLDDLLAVDVALDSSRRSTGRAEGVREPERN